MARLWTSTMFAIVLLLPTTSSAGATAADEPVIHMPFACGDVWTASTRFKVDIPAQDGKPAEKHGAHRPSLNAVDFNKGTGDLGSPVYAGADGGTVVNVYADAKADPENDANGGYGNLVDVSYPGGVTLRFAHLDTVTIGEDTPSGSVMAGTQIGTVGSTGLGLTQITQPDGTKATVPSTAYHLHYEQIVGGSPRPVVIEGETWTVGESNDPTAQIADDHDDLANHPGIANTSRNCPDGPSDTGSDTPESPSTVAPAVQWIEPVDGAKVGPSLQLSAWPTPVLLDGQLSDPTDIERVDFTASWSGGSAPACSATSAGDDGTWSCTADLAAMGVPAGSLELSFDVLRADGSTLTAPGGTETVTFAVEKKQQRLPSPAKVSLKAGQLGSCPAGSAQMCTPWQLKWSKVRGAKGYRIYAVYHWYAGAMCDLEFGATKRAFRWKVGPGTRSYRGYFAPDYVKLPRGRNAFGSTYFVTAVDSAGRESKATSSGRHAFVDTPPCEQEARSSKEERKQDDGARDDKQGPFITIKFKGRTYNYNDVSCESFGRGRNLTVLAGELFGDNMALVSIHDGQVTNFFWQIDRTRYGQYGVDTMSTADVEPDGRIGTFRVRYPTLGIEATGRYRCPG